MILHHYDASPFSEKIRLMFGYCGMEWQSLIAPAMPPRANLDPLTGGYRRIPVAQIGADLFCDTAIISEEIALLKNKPRLSPINCDNQINQFVNHTEVEVFLALSAQLSGREALNMLFRNLSAWEVVKFVKDRAAMAASASIKFPSRRAGKKIADEFFQEIESRLSQHHFIFGDEPSVADFSAYHPIWFKLSGQGDKSFQHLPFTNAWFDKMSDFGHGIRNDITAKIAFDEARNASPRDLPDTEIEDNNIGRRVSIGPVDYAKNRVEGILAGSNNSRWIISRTSEDVGSLHVHFPKAGFDLVAL